MWRYNFLSAETSDIISKFMSCSSQSALSARDPLCYHGSLTAVFYYINDLLYGAL
jgi:hypothetical protein